LLWILADGRKRLPMHMRCRRQVLEITTRGGGINPPC
jgi:hypothetical protein